MMSKGSLFYLYYIIIAPVVPQCVLTLVSNKIKMAASTLDQSASRHVYWVHSELCC